MEELGAGTLVGGRYRVIRLLGRGGMGTVYHAVHESLGRPVALKVLPKRFATDPRLVARFKREAETMGALRHPNIVQVSDFAFEPNGTTHLVMELLEGESLEQRLRLGPLDSDEAVSVTRQITEALAAAHSNGVVHRDLKPANIFLTPVAGAGVIVKLLDFGIAKLLDDGLRLTSTGALIGTPLYMSPEQVRGRPVTAATDVWALGICVFEMITGRPPFEGAGLPALVPQILGDAPVLPDDMKEPLRSLVERALEKDPARRLQNADEVRRLLTGEARAFAATVRAADTHPDEWAEPAATQNPVTLVGAQSRRGWVIAGLVALGVLAAIIVWAAQGSGTPADVMQTPTARIETSATRLSMQAAPSEQTPSEQRPSEQTPSEQTQTPSEQTPSEQTPTTAELTRATAPTATEQIRPAAAGEHARAAMSTRVHMQTQMSGSLMSVTPLQSDMTPEQTAESTPAVATEMMAIDPTALIDVFPDE